MRVYLIIFIVSLLGCQNQTHKKNEQIIESNQYDYFDSSDSLEFIDVDSIMLSLQKDGKASRFYKSDLIKNILYLDRSYAKSLNILVPNFIQEKGLDTTDIFSLIDPKVIQEYPVDIKNIQDYLINDQNWKATARIFKDEPIDSSAVIYGRIYTKNNTKAMFTIIDGYISGTFRATLKEGKLILEPIHIEFD